MSASIKIKISSPGKVILHGEHSVVYKKPALAAVVGVRTNLHLTELRDSQVLVFHLDSLQCSFEIQLSEVNSFVASCIRRFSGELDKDLLLKEVKDVVNAKFQEQAQVKTKTLQAIYYLLSGCLITASENALECGSEIRISSELNIGAGLGSSASFGVTLATAFLILSKQIPVEVCNTKESLALVSSWAFESERVMHGNPSGVDNTVCTYGGIVRFVKGEAFSQINVLRPLRILLVDSKVSRSTAKIVEDVAALRSTFPKVIDLIWDSMEEIVNASIPIYETIGDEREDEQKFCQLEQLFRINNDLLKAVGVTHESLERIFAIAQKNNFSSKLTGAGGGGYALVLLPPDYKERTEFQTMCKELVEAGFGVTETSIGGSGLVVENEKSNK